MNNLEEWTAQFALSGCLRFVEGPGGMPMAEIYNDLGEATIALQGAHVTGFRARGQLPLIWMSDEARFAPGKSLRGGVPVCWPWFGPHASDATLPGHGPARTANWIPVAAKSFDDGRTGLVMELVQDESVRRQCGHALNVRLHVMVGRTLKLALETTNLGDSPFTLGDALHTYFLVGDVRRARVAGLDGCSYIDKVDAGSQKQQVGDVCIEEEVDRIYLGSGSRYAIVDPAMGRKITIDCSGSASTVVWNPWIGKAEKMGDLGPGGYLRMLCVETANAAVDVVQLAPGDTHKLVAEYSSQPL